MKKKVILVFTLMLATFATGQDLIVTTSNDSIHCKITKVKKNYLYFLYKKDNRYQSTLIEQSKVSNYYLDHNPEYKIPKDSLPGYEKSPKRLLSLSGGLGYDPGRRNQGFLAGFDDYLNDLSSGYQIEADYSYFFTKGFGVGLTTNFFGSTANQASVPGTDGSGNPVISDLSNTIRVLFIGPSFTLRFLNKAQENAFYFKTSAGYVDYQDTAFYVEETITKGTSLGTISSLGYNIGVGNNLSIGIQLNLFAAYIKKITVENQNNTTEVELSRDERPLASARLDLSIGLRYNL